MTASTDDDQDNDFGATHDGPVSRYAIWPHRSMDLRGTMSVLGFVAASAMLIVVRLPRAALWPISVAVIATIGSLALAFWRNHRAARFAEIIEIGPSRVRIARYDRRRPALRHEFSTAWVRVGLTQDRRVTNRIVLKESGRSCSLGEFLSPEERKALAAELAASIERARRATSAQASS